MGGAFEGALPPSVFDVIKPGDLFFVHTLESFPAWAIMYVTKSEVSHVALYVGERRILHATPSGVLEEPIEVLLQKTKKILPATMPLSDEQRASAVHFGKSNYVGWPYGWVYVIVKGLRILSGRDWPFFRFSFLADLFTILLIADIPSIVFLRRPLLLWFMLAYLPLVGFNAILWKIRPLKFSKWTVKPRDLFAVVEHAEGALLFDAHALQDAVKQSAG